MMPERVIALLRQRGLSIDMGAVDPPVQLRDTGAGPYIAKWDEAILGTRPSDKELDDVVPIKGPLRIKTRDLLRRLSIAEHRGLANLANRDDDVLKLWNILMADAYVDVNSDEWQAGLVMLSTRAVPMVWRSQEAARLRLAAIAEP